MGDRPEMKTRAIEMGNISEEGSKPPAAFLEQPHSWVLMRARREPWYRHEDWGSDALIDFAMLLLNFAVLGK